MKCTHCGHVNAPKATHCSECDVFLSRKRLPEGKGSPYRLGVQVGSGWVDKQCSWNDNGTRCESYGWMERNTNGHGPWYCRTHFDALQGDLAPVTQGQQAGWMDDIRSLISRKTAA